MRVRLYLTLTCPFANFLTAWGSTASRHTGREIGKRWEHRKVHLDESKHADEFWTFVTRPDLDAPRWNITVYNETQVSPGYWFIAPYEEVDQDVGSDAWNAPHIYDPNGQLIWSGAPLFDGFSTFDFRVSQVQGKPMLTLIRPHEDHGIVLDDTYNFHEKLSLGPNSPGMDETGLNMHEFTTVDDGTRALYLTVTPRKASKQQSAAIGYDGECYTKFDGFAEVDTKTWEITHSWNSQGHIGLDESYVTTDPLEERCTDGAWDFLHFNSIDKFPDGDYLLSGRRTYAVYKISGKDGSIIWRLGGKKSDFEQPFKFAGQHAAKISSYNDTHTVISFLDNAFLPVGDPSSWIDHSRGMIIALDTKEMKAELVQEFKHPHDGYAKGQGNMQLLPNGHAWICWRDKALHTEHSADGKLLMEAQFGAGIRNYRSFKYPWVGRPSQPPDVRSTAVQEDNGDRSTVVAVSWNGATEVHEWQVFQTNPAGKDRLLRAKTEKTGFETVVWMDGYISHVVVKAVDSNGEDLGEAPVIATLPTADELDDLEYRDTFMGLLTGSPIIGFILGLLVSVFAVVGVYKGYITTGRWNPFSWRRRQHVYESVPETDQAQSELDVRQKDNDASRQGLMDDSREND